MSEGRVRRRWKSEEDEKLRLLVSYWGDQCGRNSHWDKIASHFENRTPKDCRKRWFHSLDPKLRRGRWTRCEDKTLIEAYQRLGPLWQRIAQLIPGRTDDQCAKRYNDVLDPKIAERLRPWTLEEDAKLVELVQKNGTKWQNIARVLEGRTGLTCRNRWRRLNKKNATPPKEKAPPPDAPPSVDWAPEAEANAVCPDGAAAAPSATGVAAHDAASKPPRAYNVDLTHYRGPAVQAIVGMPPAPANSVRTYVLTTEGPGAPADPSGSVGTLVSEQDLERVFKKAAQYGQNVVVHQHIHTSAPAAYTPARGLPAQTKRRVTPPGLAELQPALPGASQPLPLGAPAPLNPPDEFLLQPSMLFDMERLSQERYELPQEELLDFLAFNPS